MNVTLAARPATAEQLEALVEHFGGELEAAVAAGFTQPLGAYVAALLEWVETARSISAACLDGGRARLEEEAAAGGSGPAARDAMLAALVEAGSVYAADVMAVLDSAPESVSAERADAIISSLLEAVEAIPDRFPARIRAEQGEARFRSVPGDGRRVRTLKAVKRMVRPVRGRWERVVPVADAVGHELVEFEARAALDGVRRPRLAALAAVSQLVEATTAAVEDATQLIRGVEAREGAEAAAQALTAARESLDEQAVVLAEEVRACAERVGAGVEAAIRESRAALADALESLGTVERPASGVGERRRGRLKTRVRERRLEALEAWTREEAAREDTLRAELEVARIVCALYASAGEVAAEVHASIGKRLREPIQALRTAFEQAAETAEAGFAAGRPLTEVLAEVDARVGEAFAENAALIEQSEGAWQEVLAPIVSLRDGVARLPRTVGESRVLLPAPGEAAPPVPGSAQARTVPLRKFVAIVCVGRIGRDIAGLLAAAEPELKAARAEVERLRQAAAFNLTAVLRDEEVGEAEAAETVAGELHRAVGRLDALLEAGDALEDSLSEGLRTRVDALAAELLAPVRARDTQAIRQAVLAEGAKERLDSSLATGKDAVLSALATARDGALRAGRRVAEAWRWARGRATVASDEATAADLERFDGAQDDDRAAEPLPLVYRQLFTLEPLEWDDFLVGRETELERIEAAYRRWADGRPCAIAIHGEKGSGKTTLANAARWRLAAEAPVSTLRLEGMDRTADALLGALARHFGEPDAHDFDDLAERINRGPDRVVILERAHHLLLRTIGGFDAVRALLELIHATRHRVLWIVTMDRHGWRYLDRTVGVRDHFTCVIDATKLSAQTLEDAIMTRHRVSGYALRFETDERPRRGRRSRTRADEREEREAQESTRRDYFERLAEVAEGNVLLALDLWIRSVRAVDEQTLAIRMPRPPESSPLERLPTEALCTLAAISQHGGLTVEEHARVFQTDPAHSRLHLATLADRRILAEDEEARFTIGNVYYRSVMKVLEERGLA